MSERYIVNKKQIEMVKISVEKGDRDKLLWIINKISKNQFLGYSPNSIKEDVKLLSKVHYRTLKDMENMEGNK